MQENKLIKSRIWMIVLIMIVSGISATLLTAINLGTRGRIKINQEIKLKKSVLNVFDIPYDKKEIIPIFDKKVKIEKIDGKAVYLYYERGRISSVAFKAKGAGFWGPISFLVALEPNLNTIKGIEIIHQEETPGLGGRIVESKFKDQYKGRAVNPEITVDAITGATMTSKAFKKIINDDTKLFINEYKKR